MKTVKDTPLNVNFISADKKKAINSYGEIFFEGDVVGHEDNMLGTATIQRFEVDDESNEVKAITEKGYAHIDFIRANL